MTEEDRVEASKVVPLFGKDEMNLIEFPFGPITSRKIKTLEVEHQAFDRVLKREVTRRLLMTGSDEWGLPRPIDDQVLLGLKTLTHETGFVSPKITFSRYQLCRTIGWEPDGRAYKRLETSLDRIAGTTFKFKDAWWDKGANEYKSVTFHLITQVQICSRDELDRSRIKTGRTEQQLCSFIWTDVIWKSFQDGFIRTLDMQLFRKIGQGRRREVPLRLFRILDKRFYHAPVAKFNLVRLCIGTLGLCRDYSPSQMIRVLDRAAKWLIECGYLKDFWYLGGGRNIEVCFREQSVTNFQPTAKAHVRKVDCIQASPYPLNTEEDQLKTWLASQSETILLEQEQIALDSKFGSELERQIVIEARQKHTPILTSGRIRQMYIHRYCEIILAADKLFTTA